MNIRLRKWTLEDAKFISKTLSDKKIANNLRDIPYPYTIEYAKEYIEYILSDENDEALAFIIELDGKTVGNISVEKCDNDFVSVNLGYYIDSLYWNKGIATYAVKLMIDYLFSNTNIKRIYAEVFSDNISSSRVLEKNGFIFDCLLRNDVYKDTKLYYLRKD